MNDALAQALALAGGAATAADCPSTISAAEFGLHRARLEMLGEHFDAVLRRAGVEAGGAVALTASPALACRTYPAGPDTFLLAIPLGLVARIRSLARLLLRYWGNASGVRVIHSALDPSEGGAEVVPTLLRPLLLEEFDRPALWDGLARLDAAAPLDARFDNDVQELVHLAVVYLAAHELTHVMHGHQALLAGSPAGSGGLPRQQLQRGVELDADDGAAAVTLLIVQSDVARARVAGADVSIDRAWLRLGYAVTMLFAITDTHRRWFGHFNCGAYAHPMVRCELFFDSAERAIDGPEAARAAWRVQSTEGWRSCVMALEELTLAAMRGEFGETPAGHHFAPLHTLSYSATPMGVTDRATLREYTASINLRTQVRKLLPLFNRTAT